MDKMIEGFGQYGPAWLLIGVFLMMFIAACWTLYGAGGYFIRLLFDNTIDPTTQEAKGLLVPFIREHLGVFQRTERITASMEQVVNGMAASNKRDLEHAERLEKLMSLIELRLKALDETNNQKVHRALVQLSEMLLDIMGTEPANESLVTKHRAKIRGLLDSASITAAS